MKSHDKLKKFLQEEYIDNPTMGSPDMSTAIRDVLTDLYHIGDELYINIRHRLMDAEEVYEQEQEEA
jgi:hypothetical protein